MPNLTVTLELSDSEYQALEGFKELHGFDKEDKALELLAHRVLSNIAFR